MCENRLLPFALPAVAGKTVIRAFDGGRLSSDAGGLLLREVKRKLRMADRLRFRMFAIAAGYEDAGARA